MKRKILVIDDDPAFRAFLKLKLEKLGYRVVVASDGLEGEKRTQTESFDLAIIDIFMPKQEGIATILNLKKRSTGLKLIAMTGGSPWLNGKDYLKHAVNFGACAVLEKPISDKQLRKALDKALNDDQD